MLNCLFQILASLDECALAAVKVADRVKMDERVKAVFKGAGILTARAKNDIMVNWGSV